MRFSRCFILLLTGISISIAANVRATVVSGNITDWEESGPVLMIGDGTNHVSLWWSINTVDRGFFYGSDFTGDSDVAFAPGITDVTQITDASALTYTSLSIGPLCDADCDPDGFGDFIVWNNINTGYFGVLRLDDIFGLSPDNYLNATWWFQTDGTGDFSGVSNIPEPSFFSLVALALLAHAWLRSNHRA